MSSVVPLGRQGASPQGQPQQRAVEIPIPAPVRRAVLCLAAAVPLAVLGYLAWPSPAPGGDGQRLSPPVAVLSPRPGEAAVMVQQPGLDLRPGDAVRVIIAPPRGRGIAYILAGRVLSYDGKTAVVAVPQEEAAKFRSDFAEGRAVLAAPGEAAR